MGRHPPALLSSLPIFALRLLHVLLVGALYPRTLSSCVVFRPTDAIFSSLPPVSRDSNPLSNSHLLPPLGSFLSLLFFPSFSHILFSVLSSSYSTASCSPNTGVNRRNGHSDRRAVKGPRSPFPPLPLPYRHASLAACHIAKFLIGDSLRCRQVSQHPRSPRLSSRSGL